MTPAHAPSAADPAARTKDPSMLDPVGDRTMTDLLAEQVAARPDQVFLVFEASGGDITELTYAAFQAEVERCARGLAGLGVTQGDFVVLHLRNSPEFLVGWFAMARLGAVLVPSNVANTAGELEHLIGFSGARVVITEPSLLAPVEAAAAQVEVTPEVVIARGPAPGGQRTWDEVLAAGVDVPDVHVSSNDLAQLIFTSGTTRKPKAVMLTHAICLRSGLDSVHCLWLGEGERCLTALPLFHVNAQAMSLFAVLTVGGTLVVVEEFRASRFWEQVRRHRATQTCVVAMQLRTLLAQPPDPADRDHVVKKVFFAINVTDAEKEGFEERFGVSLINGYGLSEAMTLLAVSPVAGPRRWPSIGRASPGRRVELVDDEGVPVAQGEVGEITVLGTPGRDIMLGYYRDEETTAAALRDGRLYTGDNAYADAQGYLYFFDRKKDMIKRAGENVSAIEVESVLSEHPGVAEACVVGIPDPIRDEAVAAVVVAVEPGGLTEEDVLAHCRARLSKFKVPTVVRFAEELPKTSIGKIKKDEVRKGLAGVEVPTR
jgi:crotonobetaine/carnitine-CoA ligase